MALICTYFVSRLFLVFRVLFVPLQYEIEKNTRTMARNKKAPKAKEPIRLRMKDLSNGNKSLYLDIYRDGKRTYEYLKMYLIPENCRY